MKTKYRISEKTYTTVLCLLANAIFLGFCACGSTTIQRKVSFSNKPNIVKGTSRVGTYSIDQVTFEPLSESGTVKDIWPKTSVREVEQTLRRDLSSQAWLGAIRDADAEWKLNMACKYKATGDTPNYWLLGLPIAGVGLMGTGGALIGTGKGTLGTTLLISGAVVALVGGFIAAKPLFKPLPIVQQEMTCQSQIHDRFDKEVFTRQFSSVSREEEPFEPFFEKAEVEIFSGLRDGLAVNRQLAKSAALERGSGSIAVMDLDAGSVLDDNQRSMIAKLIASELQGLGVKRVLGVDDVKAVLGFEKQRQLMGCTDDSCVAQFGNVLGVQRIVAGSVGRLGSSLVIEIRLINVAKFAVDARSSKRAGSLDGLLDLIPQLARDLLLH